MEITNDLLRGFQVGLALEPTKSVVPSHSSIFLGVKGDTSGIHSPTAPRATFTLTLVRLENVLAVMRERKTAERILPPRGFIGKLTFHLASLTWASNWESGNAAPLFKNVSTASRGRMELDSLSHARFLRNTFRRFPPPHVVPLLRHP